MDLSHENRPAHIGRSQFRLLVTRLAENKAQGFFHPPKGDLVSFRCPTRFRASFAVLFLLTGSFAAVGSAGKGRSERSSGAFSLDAGQGVLLLNKQQCRGHRSKYSPMTKNWLGSSRWKKIQGTIQLTAPYSWIQIKNG
jgi:hypothetical protein